MSFADCFQAATENLPYDYQRRLACGPRRNGETETDWLNHGTSCRSQLINVPTGLGKTAAVVLAWLWNRFLAILNNKPSSINSPQWPRRLVYCLPMRTLVEQTDRDVRKWLVRLARKYTKPRDGSDLRWLARHSPVILMGGEDADREWDIWPEKPAILIGTQDMVLSRALNRGYGISRYRWPMHFGLLNNDCLWVMDETQLMGVSVESSAQLDAFRARFDTCGPCATWWMSATLDSTRLATVDHLQTPDGWGEIRLEKDDLSQDDVKARVRAKKNLMQCDIALSAETKNNYPKQLAESVSKLHQPGSLTLVVVNNVARAQELYAQLQNLRPIEPVGLIHSRFRTDDRKKHETLLHAEGGRIVVATQALEAGVDISARTLITELAPWSSLVQRFGRCNRRGEFKREEARVFWIHIEAKDGNDALVAPYDAEELQRARNALKTLEDVSPESLQNVEIKERRLIRPVIRRKDIVELFDTTPDLAGHDLDISRYIRDGHDTDVQVFWRDLGGRPPTPDEPEPARDELCRVSLPRLGEFLTKLHKAEGKPQVAKLRAYVWHQLAEEWRAIRSARPGVAYLLDVQAGGYSTELGWFGAAKLFDTDVEPVTLVGEKNYPTSYSRDKLSFQRDWVLLRDHTCRVVEETTNLIRELVPDLIEIFVTAARWHDIGKAHRAFRDAIRKGPHQPPDSSALYAKSKNPPASYAPPEHQRYFRHELASALAWLQAGPPNGPDRDLTAFLIAAHHGKVRLSIRSLPGEEPPSERPEARIARGILQDDPIGPVEFDGISFPAIPLDLSLMEMGHDANHQPSWLARMLALRERFGPFRLAYLESLLRAADIRASAQEGRSVPAPAAEDLAGSMTLREGAGHEGTGPVLSGKEKSLVAELVAEGLSIQEKFRPEPLYKQTGKGHYESKTVEEIRKAKKAKGGQP